MFTHFTSLRTHCIGMVITAFLIRAAFFIFLVQPHERYKQPDSPDYHHAALCMAIGNGMHRFDNGQPIFWRTPGYPAYLALFYRACGVQSALFSDNQHAQRASIWVQIIATSFIPLIVFALANTLVSSATIALLAAWISVFHLGFVLASTYLLTDALASLFFYIFLIFLYAQIMNRRQTYIRDLIIAACMLSIYTWMRPMGEFVGILSTALLACCTTGSLIMRCKKASLFALVFALSLAPWYVRNYRLTGDYFFCPALGIYLNCFSVPKIVRTATGIPLEQAHQEAQKRAGIALYQAQQTLPSFAKTVSPNEVKKVAWPIICKHPFIFAYDWLKEAIKTTFDLYASQLVAFANGSFFYDPMEEFLTEKIAACLWTQAMPCWMRTMCFAEFAFSILLWIGIFVGIWLFLIRPLFYRPCPPEIQYLQKLWFTTGIMIGLIVCMTGGFGYARLRMPIEPIMIILSLVAWQWLLRNRRPLK